MELDQFSITLRPNPRRGNLRVHVAKDQIRKPDIGPQHVPDLLILLAGFVNLYGLKTQTLGVAVDGVDYASATGCMRSDVEMVRRCDGKTGQLPTVKRRHDEGHVGTMGGSSVRVVVHEYVAGLDGFTSLGKLPTHSSYVTRDRTRLQRSALLGLGQLAVLNVDQRRSEVLRLTNDARIGHPHEFVAHLDGDVFQRALDDARGNRIDEFDRASGRQGARSFRTCS